MKFKPLTIIILSAAVTGVIAEEEKTFSLSARTQSTNSATQISLEKEAYASLLRPLSGLRPAQIPETISNYKQNWQTLTPDEKYEDDRFDLFYDVTALTFGEHPERRLSLLWPPFLLGFLIWFIRQYKKVFIQRLKL